MRFHSLSEIERNKQQNLNLASLLVAAIVDILRIEIFHVRETKKKKKTKNISWSVQFDSTAEQHNELRFDYVTTLNESK